MFFLYLRINKRESGKTEQLSVKSWTTTKEHFIQNNHFTQLCIELTLNELGETIMPIKSTFRFQFQRKTYHIYLAIIFGTQYQLITSFSARLKSSKVITQVYYKGLLNSSAANLTPCTIFCWNVSIPKCTYVALKLQKNLM